MADIIPSDQKITPDPAPDQSQNSIPQVPLYKPVIVTEDIDRKRVLDDINKALDTYNGMAKWLRRLLFILGFLAISLSLFVSAFVGVKEMENNIKFMSYISSVSLALLSYFSIASKGNNCRNAWRHLQNARCLFYAGSIDLSQLIKAYGEAEAILGETNFTYQIPTNK